jgi:hypothetical protein
LIVKEINNGSNGLCSSHAQVAGTLLVTSDPRPDSPEWIMLGSDFDVSIGIAPVLLTTGANTGARQLMQGVEYMTVLYIGGAGDAAEPPVLTLRQHTAVTSGDSADLAVVTEFWTKTEATLDNDEAWVRTGQAAGATVTGTAEMQQIIVFQVRSDAMTAGPYLSVDVADPGDGLAHLGTLVYLLGGLGRKGIATALPVGLR